MREHIVSIFFCLFIICTFSITLFNQVIGLFVQDEEKSDVNKGHETELAQVGNEKEAGLLGMIDGFTSNLAGKSEGAKMASEISKATSGNTYIESTQVLLGKDNWLFYKSTQDGDPIADYQGINHYTEEQMAQIAAKLQQERDYFESLGCEFYILSIPNKASVYSEYMPSSIKQENKTSRTEIFMDYLKNNTDLNVVNAKDSLVATKKAYQVYYKTDTHFNAIGSFMTVQALKEAINGNFDSLEDVKFKKVNENYSGDLAALCDMQDTFNDDVMYELDVESVNKKLKSDQKVLIIGDSFSDHMVNIMSQYYAQVDAVNIWSFNLAMIQEYQPDVVVWECAERYTDRLNWVSLTSE